MHGISIRLFLLCVFFLTGCSDKPTASWNLTTQGAYAAAISPNGEYAAVGSILHGGSLWRLTDGERLYNWNHAAGEYSQLVAVGFSTDSKFVLTAESKRMVLWDVKSGESRGFWRVEGGALAVALSDNGQFGLVGQENYSAQYIETRSGSVIGTLNHGDDVNTVAISANGRLGVTGSEDGYVKIWSLLESKALHTFKLGDDISKVAISKDGRLAFGTLYYGKGKIWDVKTGKEITEIGYNRNTISAARFSDDNSTLLTGDTARRIVQWSVKDGEVLRDWNAKPPTTVRPSGLVVVDVSYGKNDNQVYSVFSNGSVSYWEIK